MKKIILLTFTMLIAYWVSAQDSTKFYTPINPKQIYLHNNCCFIYNNSFIAKSELPEYFKNNQAAMLAYNKSITNHKWETAFATTTLLCLIGSLATIGSENSLSGKFVLGGVVNMIIGFHFNNKSSKNLNKAVDIYNQTH